MIALGGWGAGVEERNRGRKERERGRNEEKEKRNARTMRLESVLFEFF
jgi:hypothetical protein